VSSDIDVLARIEADVSGGWSASGSIIGDADRISRHQAIDSWFDLYAGGGWEALPRPAFIGHLVPEPWTKTLQTSIAPFRAFTAQEFMKDPDARVQGIFFKDAPSPANQHQITDMTYAGIISHIVGQAGELGHCNFVRSIWPEGIISTNIDFSNSSQVDSYEVKEGNIWSRLQEIANIDFYYLYFDKTNTLNAIPHPMFGTLPTPTLTLTSSLLLEPLQVTDRNTEQVGQVRLNGQTPAGEQITAAYPTNPLPGPIVNRSGYLATDNSNMAAVAQRMFRFENRDVTVVARVRGGLGLMLDLLDRVAITYASAADGVAWSAKTFWVHKILVEVLANFTARTTLTLEAEN
jgi:hypothetical protein